MRRTSGVPPVTSSLVPAAQPRGANLMYPAWTLASTSFREVSLATALASEELRGGIRRDPVGRAEHVDTARRATPPRQARIRVRQLCTARGRQRGWHLASP